MEQQPQEQPVEQREPDGNYYLLGSCLQNLAGAVITIPESVASIYQSDQLTVVPYDDHSTILITSPYMHSNS